MGVKWPPVAIDWATDRIDPNDVRPQRPKHRSCKGRRDKRRALNQTQALEEFIIKRLMAHPDENTVCTLMRPINLTLVPW